MERQLRASRLARSVSGGVRSCPPYILVLAQAKCETVDGRSLSGQRAAAVVWLVYLLSPFSFSPVWFASFPSRIEAEANSPPPFEFVIRCSYSVTYLLQGEQHDPFVDAVQTALVSRVETGSPAYFAGLRSGQRILAVDGVPVSDRSYIDIVKLIADRSAGRCFLVRSCGVGHFATLRIALHKRDRLSFSRRALFNSV